MNLTRALKASLIVSFIFSWGTVYAQETVSTLWDKGLFLAGVSEIQQAEKDAALPGDKDAGILYSHGWFDYQENGSLIRRNQTVYRIDTEEGLRSWGQIEVNWSPWHQDRPRIRGRVTNPDGTQAEVTEKDFVEANASSDSDSTYTDEKILKGPLPRVKIGSIVELETTYLIRPLLENCGILQYWTFSKSAPASVIKLTISLPPKSPFSMKARGSLVPTARDRVEKARKIWEFVQTKVFEPEVYEDGLPRSVNTGSYLVFSTAPGWEKIAQAYSAVIDQKIQSQPLALPQGAVVAGDLRQTSINLMRWITSKVRYIALELGQNSIVPYGPADIVKRGYGDCKDKAMILTSFLRQAGYDASVSLIQVAQDEDITVQVPGMEGFDHAVVYVAGKDPLWLDPTVEFGRDEKLPYWDQGRWSLPARAGMKEPLSTPFTDLSYHRSEETLDYYLQDEGNSNVEQKSVYWGGMDLYRREGKAYKSPDNWKKDLESYADKTFKASLGTYSSSDPYNFQSPFTTNYQFKDSRLATTKSVDARAVVKITDFLEWIPKIFWEDSKEKRKNDYFLHFPMTAVETHRFHPPKGFVARGLPEEVHQKWGAFSFDLEPRLESDGTVDIKLTLTAGQRFMTAAEFEQTRSLVGQYYKNASEIELNFDLEAEVLLSEGRSAEAFQKYRDVIAEDPAKSIHEVRLSRALLKTGLGLQAVLSAAKATELDPQNASVWENLAWIKQHDALGRRFGANYDRPGSLTAYEKSLKLDPSSVTTRADLAILHEFDAYGLRYSDPKELELAALEYEKIKKDLADYNLKENYALVLLHLGRTSDAKTYVQSWESSDSKEMFLLVCNALLKSPEQAVKELNPQLTKDKKANVLESASRSLLQLRQYPQAVVLLRAAAKGSSQAANLDYRADVISKVKKIDLQTVEANTPDQVVLALIESIFLCPTANFDSMRRFVTPEYFTAATRPSLKNGIYQSWVSAVRTAIRQDSSLPFYADFTAIGSKTEVQISGNQAYVVLRNPASSNEFVQSYFLKQVDNHWLIWGTTADLYSVVTELTAGFQRGEFENLAKILDWMALETNPRSEFGKGYFLLWPRDGAKTSAAIKATLAYLRATNAQVPSDLTAFESDPPPSFSEERKLVTLCQAASSVKNWQKEFDFATKLYKIDPEDYDYQNYYYRALMDSKKYSEAEKAFQARLKLDHTDQLAREFLIYLYTQELKPQAIKDFIAQENIEMTAMQMNNLAWVELFEPKISDTALEWARKSVNMTNSKDAGVLHTLATLYAEVERYEEARTILNQAIALSVDDQPQPHDWYVLGRISEGYGFFDAAKEAYSKVDRDDLAEDSTWALAQKRLNVIRQKEKELR